MIIAWKWRCVPGCFSPKPRLQSLDKAVLFSKTSVCIYQYVQVDEGVQHKSLNTVYNISRYCHCVEEPLMQNMSQSSASSIEIHNMNALKYKVAPLLRNNFRHLVTAQINKAGWCIWLEFDRFVSNLSNLTGTIETDPFWCTRCCQWGLGCVLVASRDMLLWTLVELCWMFSCKKSRLRDDANYRKNTYKLKHARATVDYVHNFATPSTGYEMIPPRHEKLWTASLRRKSGRCPTQKCP